MLELIAALRRLRRRPVSTLTLIAILALGIALATASFTLVETVLLRPLPFDSPDELVRIEEHRKSDPSFVVETSHPFLELWRRELALLDVAGFAGLGLLLAAAGLYALMAYSVTRRTRELAIRGALGARPAELARGTLWTSAVRALLGIGLGALAFALGQAALAARLDQLLLGTRLGWSGIGLFASGLLGVALASALAPSLRAARQEPSRLLRS